ncbi:MAG: hypothetical protein JWN00_2289 [Actinomycetia bacterium]|nr:hypothetical protein [Actinomycetes bacterium]
MFAVLMAMATIASAGYFAVSGLADPGGLVPGGGTMAAKTYAAYMTVRSAILLGALGWFAARRAWRPLSLLLALNGAVQLGDAVIGIAKHQVPQTLGPVVFAVALFAAAALTRRVSA